MLLAVSFCRVGVGFFSREADAARCAFGPDTVEFYVHHARLESQAFANSVTDWELKRYFERI